MMKFIACCLFAIAILLINIPVSQAQCSNVNAPKADFLTTNSKFVEEVVKHHNIYRKRHGSPPVKLNDELSRASQFWVDTIALKRAKGPHSGYMSENMVLGGVSVSQTFKSSNLVYQWYSEVNQYKFEENSFIYAAGHFTQLVWKASREIGVAYACGVTDSGEATFTFAVSYCPPGNVIGVAKFFKENVLPSSINDSSIIPCDDCEVIGCDRPLLNNWYTSHSPVCSKPIFNVYVILVGLIASLVLRYYTM